MSQNSGEGGWVKIAILVSAFPPRVLAGTEIATYHIATHLAKIGHEVHVITRLDEGLSKESFEESFYIHRVRVINRRILESASFFINTFLILKKVKPDLVHAQSILMVLYALLIKILLRKPFVVYGRGTDIYLASGFDRLLYKLTLPRADAVIALTNDMKGAIQRLCHRDVFVIPNGVDIDRFSRLSREKARIRLNIVANEKILLFVGWLRPVKGVRYLIESMSIIKQRYRNIRLLIVGDGKDRQNLEELAKKLNLARCISFTGQVPNETVAEYMAASDLFILPSLSEGFPVTASEAMASGLPIVATRVRGMPDIVREDENGFLVESKNPEQIAERVLLLLGDDGLRERISKSNREQAKQYSWQSVARSLEGIYSEVTRK